MHYEIHGNGFPLVMIMGLGSVLEFWDEHLIEELAKKYKTVVFDNRGVGGTDKPDIKYSIKIFADDTAGLMNALKIERAHVLGISMGGMIAQEFTLNYPEKVEKLVLCATNCGLGLTLRLLAKIGYSIAKLHYKRKLKTPESRAEFLIPSLYTEEFIKANPEYMDEVRQRLLKYSSPFEDFERQTKAILKFNTRKRLKNIAKPTLIMQGKKDSTISYKNAFKLAELIPYSKLALFEKSAHALFNHEPESVLKTLLDFLA